MKNHQPKPLLVLAALAAWGCAEGVAHAKKRVVVLDVEGARNRTLENTLSDLVAEEAQVIPSGEYRKAAKKLRATKLAPEEIARVASKLDADGVLEGLIVAENGRYTFHLRLHEGNSGRTVKKMVLRMRTAKLSAKMEDQLADRLLDAIAKLPRLESFEEQDGDPAEDAAEVTTKVKPPKARRAPIEDEDADDPRPARAKKHAKPRRVASADDDFESALEVSEPNDDDDEVADAGDDEDDDGDRDADDEDSRVESSSPARVPAVDRAATVSAGVAIIQRTLAFTARADMMNAPAGYRGAPTPAALVSGEVFPLAMTHQGGGLANLGIGFAAHKVVGMQTRVADPTSGMTVSLATDETAYGFDVRYRHRIGLHGPELVASVGWSKLRFQIDRTQGEVDVPNSTYRYIHPGVELRLTATPRVRLSAAAALLLITDTGQMQAPDQYGAAKMTGGEGGVGVEVLWGQRLVTRLGADVAVMAYQFTGAGAQTTDRDGDPTTVDVGGALDRYLSATLTAGYLF